MTASLPPLTQWITQTGIVAVGYKLGTYQAGTVGDDFPLATYYDEDLQSARTNPVLLNADGAPASGGLIYLQDQKYKLVLTDENDVEIDTWDNYAPPLDEITSDAFGEMVADMDGGESWLSPLWDFFTAAVGAQVRKWLSGTLDLYVRTDGSDTNDGLANTSGGAFLTIGAAARAGLERYDGYARHVRINVGNGTYNEDVAVYARPTRGGRLIFQAAATAESVTINGTSYCFAALDDASFEIRGGFYLVSSGHGLFAEEGKIRFSGVRFGACTGNHQYSTRKGYIEWDGNYDIKGSAASHHNATHEGHIRGGSGDGTHTVTFVASVAFSIAFAYCQATSDITLTGNAGYSLGVNTVTGIRFIAVGAGAIIQWALANETSFPGDAAGREYTGGRYVTSPADASRDFWVIDATYDLSTATGTKDFTGFGFQPGLIEWRAAVDGSNLRYTEGELLVFPAGSVVQQCTGVYGTTIASANDSCMTYYVDGSNYVKFTFNALLDGGVRLTCTKTGSPTGTLKIHLRARRRG